MITVTGTPHTMGKSVGKRLKPRIQVLVQEQLKKLREWGADYAGHPGDTATLRADLDSLHRLLAPAADAMARYEPPMWMELKAVAEVCDLQFQDLLLVLAFQDLLSLLRAPIPACNSSTLILPPGASSLQAPCQVFEWFLPPDLTPYVVILRRIPDHGPSTLTLTLGGLAPIAGISEANLAVSCNDLRVTDAQAGGIPTLFQLCGLLDAPTYEDARARLRAAPRMGGCCFHVLDRDGRRVSAEASGERTAYLPAPQEDICRVHTNHALDRGIAATCAAQVDPTSRKRLAQLAALARRLSLADLQQIDASLAPDELGIDAFFDDPDNYPQRVALVAVLDPRHRAIHLHRGPAPSFLETATL